MVFKAYYFSSSCCPYALQYTVIQFVRVLVAPVVFLIYALKVNISKAALIKLELSFIGDFRYTLSKKKKVQSRLGAADITQ